MAEPKSRAPAVGAPVVAAVAPATTLFSFLEQHKKQIQMALPASMKLDRVLRVTLTACSRNPKLLTCTPRSVLACVIQASELGLELTGPLGQAYMVPRWNKHVKADEATFQLGYRGVVQLAYRSGQVATFQARAVREGDFFRYAYGTAPFIEHRPLEDRASEERPVTHVYAVLKLKDGDPDFEVMSTPQVEAHRGRYAPKSFDQGDSPWNTAWEMMAKKTVIHRLGKRAPLSVECQAGLGADESGAQGQYLPATEAATFQLPAQTAEEVQQLLGAPEEGAEDPSIAEPPLRDAGDGPAA